MITAKSKNFHYNVSGANDVSVCSAVAEALITDKEGRKGSTDEEAKMAAVRLTHLKGVDPVLFLKKVSFNWWMFLVLAVQYVLMHLFTMEFPLLISELELAIFVVYTIMEFAGFIYKGRRAPVGAISGMIPLFFAVLWTVALFSRLQRESYPMMHTVINSLGMITAFLILFVEYIFLIKD